MSHKEVLIKNFGSLSLVQIAGYIFPLVYLPYLVRLIGPDKFGAIVFVQAVVMYFNLVTDLGTSLYAPREIAVSKGDHLKMASIVSNILFMKIVFLLAAVFTYIAVVCAVPKFREEMALYIFASGNLIVTALLPTWFFQGIEKMVNIAAANLLSRALEVLLIFVVIRKASDYIYVPLVGFLAQMLGLFFMYYMMFAKEKIKIIRPNISSIREIMKESLPLFVSNLSVSIYTGINTIILGFLTNNSVVGYYGAAERVLRAFLSILGQLGAVFYPHIATLVAVSKEQAVTPIKKAFVVMMLFAIPATIFTFFNADEIVRLIYGVKFSLSVVPMQILSFLFIIIGLGNVFGMQILLPYGKRKEFMKPIVTAGIVSLVLNFILVPFLKQDGSALSFLISESWVSFWLYFECRKIKVALFSPKILLKFCSLIICLFIFVLVAKSIGLNLIMGGVMYVLTYGLLLIAIKLVDLKNLTVVT